MNKTLGVALFASIFFLASPSAQAYLDPGTGSLLLQLVLGGAAGAAVIAKLYWHRALEFFGMRESEPEPDVDEAEEQRPE